MDLNYGAEYEDFRKDVQAFCKEYQGVSFKSDSNVVADALNSSSATKKPKKEITRSEWQQILIEKGYIARAIPKEYGGYGGETDIIKSRIIATEFPKPKCQAVWAAKELICWCQPYLNGVAKSRNKNTFALLCTAR